MVVPSPWQYVHNAWFQVLHVIGRVLLLVKEVLRLVYYVAMIPLSVPLALCNPVPKRAPVVVITGASSGIGAGFARRYAATRKATLVLTARRVAKLQEVAAECDKLGATATHCIAYDASKPDSGTQLRADMLRKGLGHCDILYLNAGVTGQTGWFEDQKDTSDVEWVTNVDYFGYVRCVHALLPLLKKPESAQLLVNVSIGRYFPISVMEQYMAAKYAVDGFFKCLKPQLTEHNISTHLLYFGTVKTEIYDLMTMSGGEKLEAAHGAGNPDFMTATPDSAAKYAIASVDNGEDMVFFPRYETRMMSFGYESGLMDPHALITSSMLKDYKRPGPAYDLAGATVETAEPTKPQGVDM